VVLLVKRIAATVQLDPRERQVRVS
jgi:hypothetical protein